MRRHQKSKKSECGAALLEFAIGASVFLTATFAVVEFGRLLWTHNALTDAARRGARYAINHPSTDIASVQNVVVYGSPDGGTQPLINDLKTSNVKVQYTNFRLMEGTVSVDITNYQFNFIVPLFGTKLNMPTYHTTLTGENVGLVPPDM